MIHFQELQRFIGSQFIQWDGKMYDEKLDETAKANNSDINEDLGQIEYLFSDKTGTLTENEMIFKQCAIDGLIYEEKNGKLFNTMNNQFAQLQVYLFFLSNKVFEVKNLN